jgi:hypothetical protein
MDLQVGDRLIVHSKHVGEAGREGVIVEVIAADSPGRRCRVRWSDGHETVVVPGPDAVVVRGSGGSEDALETQSVTIELHLEEDSEHCQATATMATSIGTLQGVGRSRRNPVDPVVPMIGEELAIARALGELASKLEAAAEQAMSDHESRPRHLIS